MPDISIKIRDKIAQVQGSPQIICGNSDYCAVFDFDAEWGDYDAKTMHIVWRDISSGNFRHYDVQFSGSTAVLPALYGCDCACIGVYAGDIRTTTPARVPCLRCITDGEPYHDDPPPDIYLQLMDYMEQIIEGGGGGGSAALNPKRVTMLTSFYRSAPLLAAPETARLVPMNRWNFWQETNDNAKTTATLTATPTASCLLVAAVMHRGDTVSIGGDGWTKVIDGKWTTIGISDQQITVWTKPVSAGTYSVTVTQPEERMSMKLIALYGAAGLTVVDDALLATVPYTPAAKTGKRRLYALSSKYASAADNPPNAVTVSYSGIDLRIASELRFSAFYDYDTESSAVPSFSYFDSNYYVANSMNALVFDIEEG